MMNNSFNFAKRLTMSTMVVHPPWTGVPLSQCYVSFILKLMAADLNIINIY